LAAAAKAKVEPVAAQWTKTIADYDREFKKWEGRVEKIIRRYKDEGRPQGNNGAARFNILWSNVQTAIPAVFSRLPKPDVSRRYKDSDPVGRVAALLLERGLEFEIEHYPDYRAAMRNCVQDRYLGGRGVSWVRYEPHIAAQAAPEDGVQITEDADEAQAETLEYECAPTDYVHWKDFGHTLARTWEEVTGVWRKVYMDREALVERFGEEIGNKVPLDTRPEELKKNAGADVAYEALVYEIWDKKTSTALWLSKSLSQILDSRPNPLKLENFWPCPKPLFATLTSDSLVPVPDFSLYQDQANTLDVLADRIEGLIKALQVKGVHDAAIPELARLFTEGENGSLLPVKNWAAFAEKMGLKGAIDIVDLTPIFNALKACYESAEQQKNQIYEITGLADIIRGSTDPNETAAAQKLKGNFGSMRLRSMQADVAQFAAEILQIKAQIIATQFTPDTIAKIGGAATLSQQDQALVAPAIQLLKNSPLRDFRIEITADSMIQMDELQEKQDRMEMLEATSKFLKEAIPAAESTPEIAPLLLEMLKFGVTGFKVGKTIEGAFDEAADKLKALAAQPRQPKVDPDLVKIQAEGQQKAQELQQKAAHDQALLGAKKSYDQFKANLDAQVENAKQEAQAQQELQQEQLEAARAREQAQLDASLKQAEMARDERIEAAKMDFERWKVIEENKTKIAIAEISAAATLQSAQLSAAKAEAEGGEIKDKQPAPTAPQAPIHIHMPSGKRTIRKQGDGSYTSEEEAAK
jgi:hypothetical protein